MKNKPLFVETIITRAEYEYDQASVYCYRKDNGRIIDISEHRLSPAGGQEVMLWFEIGNEDLVSPCVVAWKDNLVDLKERRRPAYGTQKFWVNFERGEQDDYNLDPSTRKHFDKYRKAFARVAAAKRTNLEIAGKIQTIKSIKVYPRFGPYGDVVENAKNELIKYLKSLRADVQR